jgi:flagellar hook-associated protein 2
MGISFDGLASGMDTNAIIEAMMQVARLPIERLEAKKDIYENKQSLVGTLMAKLSALRTAAQGLDTESDFKILSASSTDSTKISGAATSSAAPGSYQIQVSSLVQAERTYSDPFAAKDQTGLVGAGTLSIQVGATAAVEISIDDSTDTLETVASKINNSAAEVSAAVMYDGSSYRLVVTGDQAGASYGITFGEDGTLALDLDDAANQKQEAKDATIVMDGMTITSGTNQITDAIPGVTLTLSDTTDGETESLEVALDQTAIEENVQAMLTAYNDVVDFINQQFTYDGEVRLDTLMGDSATRTAKSQIQSIVVGEIAALTGSYTALSRIGITSSSDGTLTLNTTEFRNAMADDQDAVMEVFTYTDGDSDTDNDGVAVRLARTIKQMLQVPDGLLQTHKDGFFDQIADIDDEILRLENNLDTYEQGLLRKFAAMEEMLSALQGQGNYLAAQPFAQGGG